MALEVIEHARGRWHELLPALGIPRQYLTGKHGPCPLCGGKDRFRFADSGSAKPRAGVWYCNQCGSGDGIDLVQRSRGLMSFAQAAREVEAVLGGSAAVPPPAAASRGPTLKPGNVKRFLRTAAPAQPGDPVDQYLADRGLQRPPRIGAHPAVAYYENGVVVGRFPAMIGTLRRSDNSAVVGAHITYLAEGGRGKAPVTAPRKIRKAGSSISGAAVHLYPAAPHLGIAEGIETAIAAALLHDLPVWAALSAQGIARFMPPAGTEHITIFADNDSNATGQRAAEELEIRLRVMRISCDIRIPACPGTDWADEINAMNSSRQAFQAKP